MAKKKETRGGQRDNAGRDKLPAGEKKAPVTVYVQQQYIDKYSGIDNLKLLVKANIERGTLKKL